jgi:hypothetical protein
MGNCTEMRNYFFNPNIVIIFVVKIFNYIIIIEIQDYVHANTTSGVGFKNLSISKRIYRSFVNVVQNTQIFNDCILKVG